MDQKLKIRYSFSFFLKMEFLPVFIIAFMGQVQIFQFLVYNPIFSKDYLHTPIKIYGPYLQM